MASTTVTQVPEESIAWGRLPWAGLLATLGSAVANAVLYFIGAALGAFPETVIIPASGQPMTVGPVIISSILGAVAGLIVFAILGRFTRRPIWLFRIVSVVALILSFLSPLSIPGAPIGMILVLELMHVIAAAIIVGVLTTVARNER